MHKDIFLTFDIDWAADFVLEHTLDLLDEWNIPATFFVTHETPLLARMRANPNIELGIHPNFNSLLDGRREKTFEVVVDELLEIVPEAKSWRSHSLVEGTPIRRVMAERGIIYDLNTYVKMGVMKLAPYLHTYDIVKLPFFFEDDLFLMDSTQPAVEEYLSAAGLKIFDFHPIHIYLNTERLSRYEHTRSSFYIQKELDEHINQLSYGIKQFLLELMNKARARCFLFKKISDINIVR